MKKIGISLVITLVIIAISTGVFAARFESLGMNIDLPEGYYNLKAGIDTNDAKIEFYTTMMQTSKDVLSAEYSANGTLYNGINSNLANEIYITEAENKLTKSIFHLNTASEKQFEEVKEELKSVLTAQGMTVSKQEEYTKNDITYIHTVAKKGEATSYQYYTVVNGVGITISLQSSDSSAKEDALKKMIDSIKFDELLEKPTDFTSYILIAVTAILVIMVLVLMYMAFFSKKDDDDYEEDDDEEEKVEAEEPKQKVKSKKN